MTAFHMHKKCKQTLNTGMSSERAKSAYAVPVINNFVIPFALRCFLVL